MKIHMYVVSLALGALALSSVDAMVQSPVARQNVIARAGAAPVALLAKNDVKEKTPRTRKSTKKKSAPKRKSQSKSKAQSKSKSKAKSKAKSKSKSKARKKAATNKKGGQKSRKQRRAAARTKEPRKKRVVRRKKSAPARATKGATKKAAASNGKAKSAPRNAKKSKAAATKKSVAKATKAASKSKKGGRQRKSHAGKKSSSSSSSSSDGSSGQHLARLTSELKNDGNLVSFRNVAEKVIQFAQSKQVANARDINYAYSAISTLNSKLGTEKFNTPDHYNAVIATLDVAKSQPHFSAFQKKMFTQWHELRTKEFKEKSHKASAPQRSA